MAIRVPTQIVPSTSRQPTPEGPQRAPQLDFSGLSQSLNQISDHIYANQQRREQFDLNSVVVDETNALQLDFETKKKAAQPGGVGFAEGLQSDYDTRHRDLIAEYAKRGYSTDSLREFSLRLAGLRSSMFAKGLAYQGQLEQQNTDMQAENLGTSLSQYTQAQPDHVDSALSELEHNIGLLDVDELTKQNMIQREGKVIRMGAGTGLALQNPQLVIQKLDPQSLIGAAPAGGSGRSQNPWANVAVDVARNFGLNPLDVAAVMSYETGGTFNPKVMGGTGGQYMGLIQFSPDNRAKYGINENSSPEQWTKAITGYLSDRGFKPGMGLEDLYSTINAGAPGRYNASDGNGTVTQHVNRIIKDHLAKAAEWVGPLATSEDVAQTPGLHDGAVPEAKTGIPALDHLDAGERLQILNMARTQNSQNLAQQRAAAQQTIENEITARSTTGNYAGPSIGPEEAKIIFGAVQGEAIMAKLQGWRDASPFIAGLKTSSAATVQSQVEALRPTNTADPHYAEKQQIYEAARSAATANLQLREQDPRAYVAGAFPNIQQSAAAAKTPADRQQVYRALGEAYKQLGIPPDEWLPVAKADVAKIAGNYSGMNPQQKLGQLQAWSSEMTGTGLLRPFLAQMSDHNGGPAFDLFMMTQLQGHPEFHAIMNDVLQGQQIIKEDPARRPDQGSVNKAFAGKGGLGGAISALNPTTSKIYNDQAIAIYVAQGGTVGQTVRGSIDNPKLYQDSLRRALGGRANNPDTGLAQFHGAGQPATILPPTITKDQWQGWIDRLSPGDLSNRYAAHQTPVTKFGGPVSLRDIKDEGVFIMRAPGVYAIQMEADGGTLQNQRGGEYQVHLTPEDIRGGSGLGFGLRHIP